MGTTGFQPSKDIVIVDTHKSAQDVGIIKKKSITLGFILKQTDCPTK